MSNGDQVKTSALIAYICYAIGVFVPLAAIVGVIINHIKRGDTRGTWVESHHRWMMRTFWFGLLWSIVIGITAVIPFVNVLSIIGLIAVGIWYIYRVVRGLLAYSDGKAMYGAVTATVAQTEGASA